MNSKETRKSFSAWQRWLQCQFSQLCHIKMITPSWMLCNFALNGVFSLGLSNRSLTSFKFHISWKVDI